MGKKLVALRFEWVLSLPALANYFQRMGTFFIGALEKNLTATNHYVP